MIRLQIVFATLAFFVKQAATCYTCHMPYSMKRLFAKRTL